MSGLRREELATLVGISADYLVRLEQGRAGNPSVQVVSAFVRALKLSPGERDVLFQLAGLLPPPRRSMPGVVARGVQVMIDRMADSPLAVFTATWDIVQWTGLWAELVGDPDEFVGRERNLVWRHFVAGTRAAPPVERQAEQAEAFERELVADLHRAVHRYPDDPVVVDLVAALLDASPRFAASWGRYEVAERIPARKVVVHPDLGSIDLDCDVLVIEGSDLRVVLYSAAPGSRDAVLLDRLRDRARSD